ncbi:MAG: hypothetical protein KDC54_01465 [Lewinella sp.]|nr:hypothetical protein [Lewinella sp.]
MKQFLPKIGWLTSLFIGLVSLAQAQDGSSLPSSRDETPRVVQFNGLGRAYLQQAGIDGNLLKEDTTTARQLTDGEFLLDVAINAQPNDNTEVQGILRLRNEFGGFFGAGVSVEVRELWARGLIGNALRYRVGDFDYAMTPYTFYNPDEEGMVNEPEVFRPQKDVIYYEQFYQDGNTRRLQGANLDFGLTFPVLFNEARFDGYIARIRGTDLLTIPTRFVGGGSVDLTTQTLQDSLGLRADIGFNLSHTWDDLNSGNANSGIRNLVWSVDFDVTLFDKENLGVHLLGEAGRSSLESLENETSVFDEGDSFLEVGLSVAHKPTGLRVGATFLDVGPDFFSMAAQSKRVNFGNSKDLFNRIGNDRRLRMPTLFDLGPDRSLYTYQLSEQLMAYDPRYANVMPYGQATPNRRGLQLSVDYGDDESALEAGVNVALLREIRGQGTFELKDLRQIRGYANFNAHHLLDWKKNLRLTLGLQQEQADRGGVEIEQVDLSSTLLEVGLEAELFNRCDLLLGGKFLSASGREYVPVIENFNDVLDFPAPYLADDQETLLGAGLRYRFKEDIYLTVQYQQFSYERATDQANAYDLRQFFVLYNMDF